MLVVHLVSGVYGAGIFFGEVYQFTGKAEALGEPGAVGGVHFIGHDKVIPDLYGAGCLGGWGMKGHGEGVAVIGDGEVFAADRGFEEGHLGVDPLGEEEAIFIDEHEPAVVFEAFGEDFGGG